MSLPSGASASPIPPRRFHQVLQGMDASDALNELRRFPVQFRQIGRPSIDVHLEGGQSETFCVWHTRSQSGFVTIPTVPSDVMTIRFVTNGSLLRRNRTGEHVAEPNVGMFIPFEDMFEQKTSGDFSALSGTITRAALTAAASILDGVDDAGAPDLLPIVSIESMPLRAFRRSFGAVNLSLRSGIDRNDYSFPLVEEIMIYQLLSAWPRHGGGNLHRVQDVSAAHVKRAIDYIEAHIARPLKLADIAGAAGISVRGLQLKFSQELGRTPVQFIQDRRFESVHADLRSATSYAFSVKQIMARYGFVHASDFSRRYKERYDCSPGETKRRSKGRLEGIDR